MTSADASRDLQLRPILLLAAAAFASSATTRIADPLLPQIAEEFAVHVADASVVATGYTLAYGFCQILYGPVGDRYGKYAVITIMTLLSAIATGLAAFADSLPMLGWLRLLGGAAAAALIPLAMAYIGDTVPYHGRQPVLARFLAGTMLGAIAGQACGGALGEYLGWRGVFLVLAGVYVVVGVLLANEMRSGRARLARRNTGLLDLVAAIPELIRSGRVRVVTGTVFVEGSLFFGAFAFVGAFIRSRYGVSFTAIGVLLSCFGFGALLYSALAPKIVASLGQRNMVALGGALLALCFLAIALRPPLLVLPLPIALCGFGFFLFHNTLQTLATQMAPEVRGMGVSLFAAGFFLGQGAGVWAAGQLLTVVDYPPLFIAVGVLLFGLSLVFRGFLRALGPG